MVLEGLAPPALGSGSLKRCGRALLGHGALLSEVALPAGSYGTGTSVRKETLAVACR